MSTALRPASIDPALITEARRQTSLLNAASMNALVFDYEQEVTLNRLMLPGRRSEDRSEKALREYVLNAGLCRKQYDYAVLMLLLVLVCCVVGVGFLR